MLLPKTANATPGRVVFVAMSSHFACFEGWTKHTRFSSPLQLHFPFLPRAVTPALARAEQRLSGCRPLTPGNAALPLDAEQQKEETCPK